MENLFKYAKKELSQDAFLLWVAANINAEEKDLRTVARKFIVFLSGRRLKEEDIERVELHPQWNKIDIFLDVILRSGYNG